MTNKITLSKLMDRLRTLNEGQHEYLQAVYEVMEDVIPWAHTETTYAEPHLLERICTPNRIVQFSVPWENDQGEICLNQGYRVQHNNSIGPYKGGLRFHPSVNTSILKFLAFEQTFKNSLTGLPLGSGKGGSDFDPKNKSSSEIRRFCQSFVTGLVPFIGRDKDIPAGDIGVGSREISYMYGHIKRISELSPGSLTGKSMSFGGSDIRLEATGYGCVYFLQHILHAMGDGVKNKTVLVSGAGNVSLYACEKLINLGAKVLTLSDSKGFLHAPDGINQEMLTDIMTLRFEQHARLHTITKSYPELTYYPGKKPWSISADIAMPCATENEIPASDASQLVKNGVKIVIEGANMPTPPDSIQILRKSKVIYAPGKAANAGGVAVSSLEMTQNNLGYHWPRNEVDAKLQMIMQNIHQQCLEYGFTDHTSPVDYAKGANIAGFKKVADAMLAMGI
ncbi:MAG: NADP-specific glutamate dehydrogenase [Pseudomonadota bacterium]|nr:NADP-specific glutamate dehydrogenase [Pseudomonadota bacterium]